MLIKSDPLGSAARLFAAIDAFTAEDFQRLASDLKELPIPPVAGER
jgi:hypothetical protein